VAALAASVLALPFISSGGASGDPIGDKRAEAARIATKLDGLQEEAEVYAEQYNDAVIALDDVRDKVAAQQERVNTTQQRVKTARKALSSYAVGAYTSGGNDELSALLSSTDTASQRQGYVTAALGDKEDALDRLNGATSDNRHQLERLHQAKAAAAEAQAEVAEKKDATTAAVAEQRQIKSRVDGELADLVAKEQARRRAIAIRKAREAAARAEAAAAAREQAQQAAAAEKAQRAASTTTSEAPSTSARRSTARATSSSTSSSTTAAPSRHAAPAPAPAPAPTAAPAPSPAPPPPAPPSSGGASAAIAAARSVLGVPYRWAGASPSGGFDCSGLVMWAWSHGGKSLPHSSAGQYAMSRKISVSQLQPGDIVAYNSPVSHIGLYIGGGQMIHAPHTGDVVKISSIYSNGTPMAGRL
jgi:cell wall-associated NlpC family hydrolase